MIGPTRHTLCIAAILACLFAADAGADEITVETVLSSLQDPRAIAVRPSDSADVHEVFIADAGINVVRIRGEQPATTEQAVTGFPVGVEPQVLIFLEHDRLVVATNGQPTIQLYDLSGGVAPLTADAAKQSIDAPATESIVALARTRPNDNVPDLLLVADTSQSWPVGLGKIAIRAGTLDKLLPLGSESATIHKPLAVAVSKQGYAAVIEMNDAASAPRMTLNFIDPANGETVVTFPVELPEVRGLAYHPTSDNLYAINSGTKSEGGGLYRLDDASQPGKPRCKAVKIAAIANPTSVAFAPNGTLYITSRDKANHGRLLRIDVEL